MTERAQADRRGFTLAEMMIAVVMMGMIVGVAVQFFRTQTMAISSSSGRYDAQRNAQYGASLVDRDLRVAGVGVPDKQPILLQADDNAITFNADVMSTLPNDAIAVYADPDVDSMSANGLPPSRKITLPLSKFTYPDSAYVQTGSTVPTTAETISYWVAPDPNDATTNILYRRTNDTPPEIVAKGLVVPKGQPVFRYYYSPADSVPSNALPLVHTLAIHNSAADTGKVASRMIDSIRLVRVSFEAQFTDPRLKTPIVRRVSSIVRISNAGLINRTTCGFTPLLNAGLKAAAVALPKPSVTLTWSPATDEAGGEKDVEQYAVYRRLDTAAAFKTPVISIPAGSPGYSFVDDQVQSGERWIYAIAALDCSPAYSALEQLPSLLIP